MNGELATVTYEECAVCSLESDQDGGVITRHRRGLCDRCRERDERMVRDALQFLRDDRGRDGGPRNPLTVIVNMSDLHRVFGPEKASL